MPVKRKTINLSVTADKLTATDADTGLAAADAGYQGENAAVWLHAEVPEDWSNLRVRLQVTAASGACDESGLPLGGVIDMPLRTNVTVPGRLIITLTGVSADGIRRTAQCDSLFIAAQDCPADPVSEVYPLAFENLCDTVENGVVRTITGSGGAKITKTGGTSYNIDVSGTGGDMLKANYASGTGKSNANKVDYAMYADTAASVDSAKYAASAETANSALKAASGSELESSINSKQPLLSPGENGGTDILSGTTVRSLKGNDITVTADGTAVTLGIDGAVAKIGAIMYTASTQLPDGWQFADGRKLKTADYPELYGAIGFRYGMGSVSRVDITPAYYTDNYNLATNIVLQKYCAGIKDASYFSSGGTAFSGESFSLSEAGDYTVYCKDNDGNEAVQYVCVPALSSAYLLNLLSAPITDSLKLAVYQSIDGSVTISLVKLAQGIQDTAYFSSAGTQISTSNSAMYYFQDGTGMPSGNYTWYTKDSDGNTAIQYFKVNAVKALTINLTMSLGSDYFKLPNLVGTVNSLLCPLIKL